MAPEIQTRRCQRPDDHRPHEPYVEHPDGPDLACPGGPGPVQPGRCIHVPPSPGQSLCQCGHQRIEMEYAARIAEAATRKATA